MFVPKKTPIVRDNGLAEDTQLGSTDTIEQQDKALRLLAHGVGADFDPNSKVAKKVLAKIDWRITPLIFAMYLLQLAVRRTNFDSSHSY